jgi:hypothetical protein
MHAGRPKAEPAWSGNDAENVWRNGQHPTPPFRVSRDMTDSQRGAEPQGRAMSLIEFAPLGLFKMRRYALSRGGGEIGRIDLGAVRQPASIVIGDATFHPVRDGVLRTAYHLDGNGTRLASAAPAGAISRRFTVQAGPRTYALAVSSWLGRSFTLTENDAAVGTIARTGFFTAKCRAELPDDLLLEVQAFLIWLVLITWRRQAATNLIIAGVLASE